MGQYVDRASDADPRLICDAPGLWPFVRSPVFRAVVEERDGVRIPPPRSRRRGAATIPDEARARHGMVWGASGSGKTMLALAMLEAELARGRSVVYVDPKGEGYDRLLARAAALGFPPEDVILLDPRSDAVPGWNPLDGSVPLQLAARDFVTLLERAYTSWGPRLADLLLCGLLVTGAHRLSLWELGRLLTRDDYREALLDREPLDPDRAAYAEASAFFREEFSRWGKAERAAAAGPVLNKIRPLTLSPFLRALLCARKTTVDVASLWARPRLVLLRLDAAVVGEETARLLAGLFVQLLLRTALRVRGPVPVILAVDELPVLERFVGGTLAEIVALARSQGLRLLLLGQNLAQVSEGLRETLFANTGFQCFFRLGSPADARLAAVMLAAGTEPRLERATVSADVDRETGEPALIGWGHPVTDPYGRPLRLRPDLWAALTRRGKADLRMVARVAAVGGVPRLYVQAADGSGPHEFRAYVKDLPRASWELTGPQLALSVRIPRPRLTGVQRRTEADAAREWFRYLQDSPVQQAVVRVPGSGLGGEPGVVRIHDAPRVGAPPDVDAYAAACARANAQSPREIAAARAWRERELRRVVTGATPGEPTRNAPIRNDNVLNNSAPDHDMPEGDTPDGGGTDDGSIY